MYKYYFIFFCLFSCSLSGIQRMKKNNGFDDNVYAYDYSSITYVKSCEEAVKTSFDYECQEKDYIDYCTYHKLIL